MTQFRYLRDKLFLVAASGYVLNRWFLKPLSSSRFLHGYFNDLLLIPAALPVVLWVQRVFRWRTNDGPPSSSEVTLHLLVWSLICEFCGPRLFHHGVADPWDIVAYSAGGLVACLWWNRRFIFSVGRNEF